MAQMTLSHMRPHVSRWISSNASSTDAEVWVAPNVGASSRLNSTGSMAKIMLGAGQTGALHRRRADAADADHRHVVAGPDVGGVDRRAPAGGDAAADEAGLVERDVVEDLDARGLVDHGVAGEGAEADHGRRRPGRGRGGGRCRPVWRPAIRTAPTSHRLECPVAHDGHWPQAGMKPNTTWSPGLRSVTPGPTSSTTPAPSWPPMIGSGTGMSPVTRCSSEWHMPDAASLTSTSPSLGGSSSMGSTLQSA